MEPTRASEGEHAQPEAAPNPHAAAGAAGPVARVLGFQRTIGNRRTAALVAGAPTRRLQRYKILGAGNIGQSVHETLTLLAVKQAKEQLEALGEDPGELLSDFDTDAVPDRGEPAGFDPVNAHESHQQFIRGVVWADDPEGLLFDDASGTTNYSTGLQWASHFGAGLLGDYTTLTARSHFGNLQFVHGMASTDAEEAETTKLNMLDWARFLVDVAARRIVSSDRLGDIAEISESFPDDGDRTVSELFGWAEASEVQTRQRAVGVLFHMIQDSFAYGHVQRNRDGEIVEFHSFGGQDHHAHERFDFLGGAADETLGSRLKQTRGAEKAIDRCAEVLEMIAGGSSTDEVVSYLDEKVLPLAREVKPAGPGTGLAKPPPPGPEG